MKSMKKIMAVITIMAFVFSSFLASASANESQVGDEIKAGVPESTVPAEVQATNTDGVIQGSPPVCTEVPTNIFVNDGLGADIDYFNTDDQISGNWDYDDHGCVIEKYKYRVIKKKSPGSLWEPRTAWTETDQKEITANASSGLITPLVEGETYRILVRAYNAAGWSVGEVKLADKSNGQTLDMTVPTINSFLISKSSYYSGTVNLSWDANDSISGVAKYELYRDSQLIYSHATNLTFVDILSADNVVFSYSLRVYDNAGNYTDSQIEETTVDDVAPAAPAISYWIGGKNIVIFFPAVPGASNYEIYRNGIPIYSGPEVKYTDTGTVRGETYNYTAYALDEAGNKSLASNTLSIYIPKPKVSSVATTGEVQGTATGTTEKTEQISPSPSPTPSGEVKPEETSAPEETQEESKTNWSLIIAIIIAAAIVVAGVLYWWYAREDEEDEI